MRLRLSTGKIVKEGKHWVETSMSKKRRTYKKILNIYVNIRLHLYIRIKRRTK